VKDFSERLQFPPPFLVGISHNLIVHSLVYIAIRCFPLSQQHALDGVRNENLERVSDN
jgi:hypothetical protein